jgi:hypothetical protein
MLAEWNNTLKFSSFSELLEVKDLLLHVQNCPDDRHTSPFYMPTVKTPHFRKPPTQQLLFCHDMMVWIQVELKNCVILLSWVYKGRIST